MTDPTQPPTPRRRARADHRPELDPACAGCPQLGLLRALRRAHLPAGGRLTCEPGPPVALAEATSGAARLVVLAGPDAPALEALAAGLGAAARVVRLHPGALAEVEAAVAAALATPGITALLAAPPCPLGGARRDPLAVDPARCSRCGACLTLGCPALSDDGGEAMGIDPAVCCGCALCAPLCRGRAIHE